MSQNTPSKPVSPYLTYRGFLVYPEGRLTNEEVSNGAGENSDANDIQSESLMLLVPESFDHKLKVVNLARELFVNLDFFIYVNLVENKHLSLTGVNFLIDTLNFIAKGQRTTHPLVWGTLLPCCYSSTVVTREQRMKALGDMDQEILGRLRPNTDANGIMGEDPHWRRINDWISQPGGFDDLTSTIRVIFGGAIGH